ncbi:MAG TPA: chemotaxis protein CheW [Candidatus Acidoferrales bacterium]|jgi:purine-binding chemotaxis protein CheW|nr:chemotaxis protein CheW [Candidatus Acidoferrales bacterium]
MDKELQIVGFQIGAETFGLPIAAVREIIRVPEITAVPNVPDHIVGVINLRGKIVPVIDLPKRFGAAPSERNAKNRIVVAELDGRSVGLIVHSASEVLRLPQSKIESPQDLFSDSSIDYVSGVGKLNGRLVILLDLQKIARRGELRNADLHEQFATPSAVTVV